MDTSQLTDFFPYERITRKQKRANKNEWFKQVANRIIANSEISDVKLIVDRYSTDLGVDPSKNDKKSAFRVMNNIYHNRIPEEFFAQFLKKKRTKTGCDAIVPELPARIRAMNILSPNINYLNSKYKRNPFIFNVINADQESHSQYKEELKKFKQDSIRKRFLQMVKDENGQDVEQDLTPEALTTTFSENYKDALAYKGEKFLRRTLINTNAQNKLVTCFLDYLIKGEPLTFKTIINGQVVYKVCDIENFYYDEEKEYSIDSDWCVYIDKVSIHDITRDYSLTKDDWEELEKFNESRIKTHNGYFLRYHILWKGLEEIGTVTYTNEFGIVEEKEVTDDYELTEGETITKRWDSVLHEVTRLGTNVFCQVGDYPYLGFNKTGKKSLTMPYSTFRFAHKSNVQHSILSIGIPYLVLHVISHYIAEACLFKHKGKILVVNLSNIPKGKDWGREKVEDMLSSKGILYVDKNQVTSDGTFNQYTSIDLGQLDQIMQLFQLSESYKQQWDDIVGIPREARGQVLASQQVGNTKTAINQSSMTVDYMYQKFEGWTSIELEGLMELAKIEILLSGNNEFLSPDDETYELMQIDSKFLMSALGVKISDSGEEDANIKGIKEWAKSVNQQDPLMMLEIQTQNSVSSLRRVLKKIKVDASEQAQAQSQQEQEFAMQLEQAKEALAQLESELRINEINAEYDRKGELLGLKPDEVPELPEDKTMDNLLKSQEVSGKQNNEAQNRQLKREEMGLKDRMNIRDNKTALKNRVSGEKKLN